MAKTYTARVTTYKPHWWSRTWYEIYIPELDGYTQARNAGEIMTMAQDYIQAMSCECKCTVMPSVKIEMNGAY